MDGWLQALVDFIAAHPHWAGLLVFVTAMAESIAVVGMIVPGSAILIAIGAVAGLGDLSLWPVLVWATLGAIAGDGLSYWLGHRYKERIRTIPALRARPELFTKGEAFFVRHGALSVAIGRFVPGVRAVIPLIAGIAGMRPFPFYVVNVLSALVWAPAHILPGAGVGLALGVLGSIAGRLVAILVAALLLVAIAIWAVRVALRWVLPGLERHYRAFIDAAKRRDTRIDRVLVALFDPDDPGTSTLLVMGTVAIALAAAFLSLAEDVFMREQVTRMDSAVSTLVQGWRTPRLDAVMIAITSLGDGVVIIAVLVAAVIWLVAHRRRKLAAGLVVTMALAALAVPLLKSALVVPRPIDLYAGADAFSFPSGHATHAAALYLSLAWLATHNAALRWKILGFVLAGLLVGAIAVSRVYLAAHWPSDVLAGLALGSMLAALYALVFRRLDIRSMRPLRLVALVVAVLAVGGGLRIQTHFPAAWEAYRPRVAETMVAASLWRDHDWAQFAADRWELDGSDGGALTLQSDLDPARLGAALAAAGWEPALADDLAGAVRFLSPQPSIDALPPLPLTHAGRFAALTLVRPLEADSRLVMRFWPTTAFAEAGPRRDRILLGSVSEERLRRPLGFASLLRERELAPAVQLALLGPNPALPGVALLPRESAGRHVLLLARPD
ncbi:bifunctional DedA family/phosphatase PAP2 family protein [Kaistia adipata]|uniref:bifunctional DedA family/phosphatase PAP2 family protein n=1 Tax=Kaistia adipata TaxID=166954 RepID=UPI000414B1A0|nr:bifunctional DedA family/phosphatase PAP2 family protein [Kaistia adipata]